MAALSMMPATLMLQQIDRTNTQKANDRRRDSANSQEARPRTASFFEGVKDRLVRDYTAISEGAIH